MKTKQMRYKLYDRYSTTGNWICLEWRYSILDCKTGLRTLWWDLDGLYRSASRSRFVELETSQRDLREEGVLVLEFDTTEQLREYLEGVRIIEELKK